MLQCKRGHPYTPENRYVRPGNGKSMCYPCMRMRSLRYALSIRKVPRLKNSQRVCSNVSCKEPVTALGFCGAHYQRQRTSPYRFGPLPEYLPDAGGCWVWQRARGDHGYGTVGVNGRTELAHRHYYSLLRSPIPAGFDLDHLCRNRACVNPDHLEAVTHRVNALRGMSPNALNARKTHCKYGHEFTPENTYHRPDKPTTRNCKKCSRRISIEKRQRYIARGITYGMSIYRRRKVMTRDSYRCHWCNGIADTVDHLVPYAEGGTNDMDNLVAACGPCNFAHRGRQRTWAA
jgi:hypothetical protein